MAYASFVSVPKQRNTPDESKRTKAGEGEGLWEPEEGDSEEDMRRKANKPLIHTYKPSKNEQKVCQIEQKYISLQRVERIAQTGLWHPYNPKTSKSSIIRSPLIV